MIFFELLQHEFKAFFRNKNLRASLWLKLFIFFGFLVFSAELIGIGWFAGNIIDAMKTGKNAKDVVNGWLLAYFFFEFGLRISVQSVPDLKIKPYLLLNIPRKYLVHFLLIKSIFSYFNLFFLMVAIPFGMRNMLFDGQILAFLCWIITIVLNILTLNFLVFFVKTTFGSSVKITLVTLLGMSLLVLVYLSGWIDFKAISTAIFSSGFWSLLCFLTLAVISYILNYKSKIGDIYLKEQPRFAIELTYLDNLLDKFKSNSVVSELVITELKLIFRNKIPRRIIISNVVLLVISLVIQFMTFIPYNFKVQAIIMAVIGLSNNYGGNIPGWESIYFDGLMTKNISFKIYLRAKYYMFIILTLAGFIPLIFIAFIDMKLFLGGVCVIMYAAGVNAVAFLGLSDKNRMRIDINETSGLNKNASMGSVFGWKFFIPLIPLTIYFPFMLMDWYLYGVLFLGFLGFIGFLLHGQFIKEFDEKYKEAKYLMLEGFRMK